MNSALKIEKTGFDSRVYFDDSGLSAADARRRMARVMKASHYPDGTHITLRTPRRTERYLKMGGEWIEIA